MEGRGLGQHEVAGRVVRPVVSLQDGRSDAQSEPSERRGRLVEQHVGLGDERLAAPAAAQDSDAHACDAAAEVGRRARQRIEGEFCVVAPNAHSDMCVVATSTAPARSNAATTGASRSP